MQRPLGVTLIALRSLLSFGVGAILFQQLWSPLSPFSTLGDPFRWGIGLLVIGSLITCVGLWRMRNWGCVLGVGVYSLSILLTIVQLQMFQTLGALQAGLFVDCLCAVYLILIRRVFRG